MTDLPKDWKMKPLGDLVTSVRKAVSPSDDVQYELWSVPSFADGKPEVVFGKEIKSGKLAVQPGDVLLSKINPRINRVWMVAEEHAGLAQVSSTEWLVARVSDSTTISAKYLQRYLESPSFRVWIAASASSVTGSHMRAKTKQILEQQVPVAPLAEQQRIAEILEEQFSRLDAALASIRTVQEKANSFRAALLFAAFDGRLTNSDTKTWQLAPLKDLVAFAPKLSGSELVPESVVSFVPMASVEEVSGAIHLDQTITVAEGKRRNLTFFQDGDVIFAKITPCMENGKIATGAGLHNGTGFASTEFHVLRSKESLSSEYLRLFLVQDGFRGIAAQAMTGAVGQRRVPRKFLENYEMLLPPLEEQARVIEAIETELSRLDVALAIANQLEVRIASERRSILHAAFAGTLTAQWRETHNG